VGISGRMHRDHNIHQSVLSHSIVLLLCDVLRSSHLPLCMLSHPRDMSLYCHAFNPSLQSQHLSLGCCKMFEQFVFLSVAPCPLNTRSYMHYFHTRAQSRLVTYCHSVCDPRSVGLAPSWPCTMSMPSATSVCPSERSENSCSSALHALVNKSKASS
jgi:hypothetical protein